MDFFDLSPDLKFKLLNGAKCQIDNSWNFPNVTSPFSRLYLVVSGYGFLVINNQKIDLIPGNLYLIPGHTTCSYYCENYLEKYYLHVAISSSNGLNIFDMFPFSTTVEAVKSDYELFERLLEINPNIDLRVTDPEVYHIKPWVNKEAGYESLAQYLESSGIIQILYSRFLVQGQKNIEIINHPYGNLKEVFIYIEQNLSKRISIEQLATMMFLSADHFTRLFKKMMGITPLNYINMKRIERAQLLLISSQMSIKEIAEQSGFNSVSFFNRMFKINAGITPLEYKRRQIEVLYHGQK